MQTTRLLTWPLQLWPLESAAVTYSLFQIYPNSVPTVVQPLITGVSTTLSYDDSVAQAYQVRPTDGQGAYGPEGSVFVVGYVPCRAWVRQKVRQSLADRADTISTTPLNWPDDELNGYLEEALIELNLKFPLETHVTILLTPALRDYPMPVNFFSIRSIEYVTVDGKLHLYLREKPFRGGESTATSYLGYPKLGIMLSPLAGRFYPGHYDVYEQALHLDWDPVGDGDTLHIRYLAARSLPLHDGDLLQVSPQDMELISLRMQMKCWLRVEGQDTRLSRWRSKDDGSRRDDMPTTKHSFVIKQLYDQLVNDRRELRPRVRRLVRR